MLRGRPRWCRGWLPLHSRSPPAAARRSAVPRRNPQSRPRLSHSQLPRSLGDLHGCRSMYEITESALKSAEYYQTLRPLSRGRHPGSELPGRQRTGDPIAMEAKLRVNLPPDPNPRALSFPPPPGTWDTHFHVYGPPQVFPYADQRLYTPPAAPIEHYLALAAAIGIERGVLVQPNVHGSDPGVTLDAIAKAQGRLRGLIKADASLTTADFESLQAGGIRGMRFNFIPHLGGRLDEDQFRVIVPRVAHLPWVLDLHTHPDMLDQLAVLIASIPLPVIIDHFGGVDAGLGMDQPAFQHPAGPGRRGQCLDQDQRNQPAHRAGFTVLRRRGAGLCTDHSRTRSGAVGHRGPIPASSRSGRCQTMVR